MNLVRSLDAGAVCKSQLYFYRLAMNIRIKRVLNIIFDSSKIKYPEINS
jgi:hypothetical protein